MITCEILFLMIITKDIKINKNNGNMTRGMKNKNWVISMRIFNHEFNSLELRREQTLGACFKSLWVSFRRRQT